MDYNIYSPEIGLNKWLNKGSEDLQGISQGTGDFNSLSSIQGGVIGSSTQSSPSGAVNSVNPNNVTSGEIGSILAFKKKNFLDTTEGWIQGMDTDNIYKWLIGGSSSSIDWAITTPSTLTITGVLNVSVGSTIAGFTIGADYLRDVANSFGLASTVTGGDDVRFWAGSTYENRQTAPLRIYESGVIFSTTVPIQNYSPSAAGTATLDLKTGNDHRITMPAGNITIALSNVTVGQKFLVSLTQDSTGSRTVTWFTTIRWSDGSAPLLTTTPNKRDTFGFICTGSNTYDAFILGLNI